MIVSGLLSEDMEKYWPLIEWAFDNFEKECNGDITAEGLRLDVVAKTRQCWIVLEDTEITMVLLTEIVGPNKRVWMDYCAGRGRNDWQDEVLKVIEDWAKSIGACGMRIFGRSGWSPFFRGKGYRETHRILEKEF